MRDKIRQSNFLGTNMINSTKNKLVKTVTKQRIQGFIVGIIASIIANYIYELLKPLQ